VDLSRPKAHDSHRILIQIKKVRRVVSAFEMLLFFPIEYISRTIRTDLVKRALTADIFITNLAIDEDAGYVYHSLTILRLFVKRIFVSLGCIDQSVRLPTCFTDHLIQPPTLLDAEHVPIPRACTECQSTTFTAYPRVLLRYFGLG
jgi:hypothetical protein